MNVFASGQKKMRDGCSKRDIQKFKSIFVSVSLDLFFFYRQEPRCSEAIVKGVDKPSGFLHSESQNVLMIQEFYHVEGKEPSDKSSDSIGNGNQRNKNQQGNEETKEMQKSLCDISLQSINNIYIS